MYQINLFLSIILAIIFLYICIYSFNKINKVGYTSHVNEDTNNVYNDIETSKVLILVAGSPVIFKDVLFLRPANVPLRPLKAPLEALDVNVKHPNFLMYKTDYLTKIQNQGLCGSCWVFAICYMIGDRVSISTSGKIIQPLSAQQLLQCYKPQSGCSGNSPEDLLFWITENRYMIRTSSDLPYLQYESTNIKDKCPLNIYGVTVEKDSVKSLTEFVEETNYDRKVLEDNIKRMKVELLKHGPFYCAMTVYDDFYTYDGLSVYRHSPNAKKIGGHAIEIIGFCDPNIDFRVGAMGKGYWICRNSWGENWPLINQDNEGCFTILMGSNECGIESRSGSCDVDGFTNNGVNLSTMRYETLQSFIKYSKVELF